MFTYICICNVPLFRLFDSQGWQIFRPCAPGGPPAWAGCHSQSVGLFSPAPDFTADAGNRQSWRGWGGGACPAQPQGLSIGARAHLSTSWAGGKWLPADRSEPHSFSALSLALQDCSPGRFGLGRSAKEPQTCGAWCSLSPAAAPLLSLLEGL